MLGKIFFDNVMGVCVGTREHSVWEPTHTVTTVTRDYACGTILECLRHHTKLESCFGIDNNLAYVLTARMQCGTFYNRVAFDTAQALLRCL